jgi:3',5'-cyclic AMP phosphodiesterase CpdA
MSMNDYTRRGFLRTAALGAAVTALPSWSLLHGAPRKTTFTFAQICDTQLGMTNYEADIERFRQAITQINDLKPDLTLICGDLVNKADKTSFADFNEIKADLKMPCHCVPGNHDVWNEPTIRSLSYYRQVIGKDYYSFKHKGYVFVGVNTSLWKAPVEEETEKQDKWLKATLKSAARRKYPIFVVGHYPLFTKKIDEPEAYSNLPIARREELLALFEKRGVVAMLTGHTHRIIINEHKGTQLVTGQATSRGNPLGFRMWKVTEPRPYKHESIALKQS